MPIRAMIAPVTPLQQNCTLVFCAKTRKAAIIDPGGETPRLLKALEDHGLTLEKMGLAAVKPETLPQVLHDGFRDP